MFCWVKLIRFLTKQMSKEHMKNITLLTVIVFKTYPSTKYINDKLFYGWTYILTENVLWKYTLLYDMIQASIHMLFFFLLAYVSCFFILFVAFFIIWILNLTNIIYMYSILTFRFNPESMSSIIVRIWGWYPSNSFSSSWAVLCLLSPCLPSNQ